MRATALVGAVVLLAGCGGAKQTLPFGQKPSPQKNSPPANVDLTDIRSFAKDLKHEGIINIHLVRYLVSSGQYRLAMKHSDTLLKESPRNPELYFLKGYALSEIGKHEEAVKELKTACDLEANYAEAWNALGITYDQMRKFDESEASYMQALQINPNSPKYLNNLGFSYFGQKEYKKAAEAYEKALALDPANIQIHNNLGFAYGMLGRYEEAFSEFRQGGTEEVAYNNMGFVYHMLGYEAQAKGMFAKAIEINPHFQKALENLRLMSTERGLFPPYPPRHM